MDEVIGYRTLTGRDGGFEAHLADLARLRIAVFREFPYLYDGTMDYETRYLQTYLACPESVLVLAIAGENVVGASTGMPLEFESKEVKQPFLEAGIDPEPVFYFGESVLLPACRGRGVYREFFNARERHVRNLGRFARTVFCGVQRPLDHPLRPPEYEALDPVWRYFGYRPMDAFVSHFKWKDIDEATATEKPLKFWEKSL